MKNPYSEWCKAQYQISALRAKQRSALMDMRNRQHPLILKKGRMRPVEVRIVDLSANLSDRVKIQRLDNGKSYWVSFFHLSDLSNEARVCRAASATVPKMLNWLAISSVGRELAKGNGR